MLSGKVREYEYQLFIVCLNLTEDENKLKEHFLHTLCRSLVEHLAAGHCGCCKFVWVKGKAGWKINLLSMKKLRLT